MNRKKKVNTVSAARFVTIWPQVAARSWVELSGGKEERPCMKVPFSGRSRMRRFLSSKNILKIDSMRSWSLMGSESFLGTFFQQIINGLTLGSIYALISLGYTLVYGILLMINFAHSEIFMAGAF